MKTQLTILPVGEQAPRPSQPDGPLPHFFRWMQYSCRTAAKRVSRLSRLVRIASYRYEIGSNLVQFRVKIFSFGIREKLVDFRESFSGFVVNSFFRSFFTVGHCC